jgi:hypothetical protein
VQAAVFLLIGQEPSAENPLDFAGHVPETEIDRIHQLMYGKHQQPSKRRCFISGQIIITK